MTQATYAYRRQGGGNKIDLPPESNLVDIVRLGMAKGEANVARLARDAGISAHVFRLTRRLLLVRDRGVLTIEEAVIFDAAIRMMQDLRSYRKAEDLTRSILEKHWVKGSVTGVRLTTADIQRRQQSKKKVIRADGKARRRFDNTLFAIREACGNNEEMVIPQLSAEERIKALGTLIECSGFIAELFTRIKETCNDQN